MNPSPILIVSRYAESLDWLARTGCEAVVLNKGAVFEVQCKRVSLPNIGYEAHSYLTYIVSHYHQLPKLMVFCQGDPFSHCPVLRRASI